MINASSFLDVDKLLKLCEDGYIRRTEHSQGGLFIYNYTPKTQYEIPRENWPEECVWSRGLILDDNHNVIARPFKKFWNLDELSRSDIIFSKPFDVFDKVDGSLGILYPGPDGPAIATRGSFTSEQAIRGTQILKEKYPEFYETKRTFWESGGFDPLTNLFEIIYPENRIVVDYAGQEDLVLLACINHETGEDDDAIKTFWPGPKVKQYDGVNCKPRDIIEHLNPTDDGNCEGFVLRFNNKGRYTRVKVKLEEYKRLHRIVTGVSNVSVWEYLKDNKPFNELLERTPDEWNNWLKRTVKDLQAAYNDIDTVAGTQFEIIKQALPDSDRKTFAESAKRCKHPALQFLLLDDKKDKYKESIWKMVRPKFSKPFREDT